MSTASGYLTVRGINVDVVYKDIKNLHIAVYPPMGRVRVAAPKRLDEDQIRLAVIKRLPWIKRQRQQFQDAARQSTREMVVLAFPFVFRARMRGPVLPGLLDHLLHPFRACVARSVFRFQSTISRYGCGRVCSSFVQPTCPGCSRLW
jgi:hypothetical protein